MFAYFFHSVGVANVLQLGIDLLHKSAWFTEKKWLLLCGTNQHSAELLI